MLPESSSILEDRELDKLDSFSMLALRSSISALEVLISKCRFFASSSHHSENSENAFLAATPSADILDSRLVSNSMTFPIGEAFVVKAPAKRVAIAKKTSLYWDI